MKRTMIYIKDMDMPVDCMECKIDCKHESYRVTGRPGDCPLEEAKTGDLIRRADAIEAVRKELVCDGRHETHDKTCRFIADVLLSALPSAEAVSREEYEETDGVITIEKQSAKDVGEIKHIVIHSPNYTRYFYNESMPTSAEAVHKPDYSFEADMVKRLRQAVAVPQSEQYKKGFEDAKRAFLLEYARESENMRKRNAQLEVMLNAQKATSAEAVQVVRCKDCRWYRDTFFNSKVNPYCVKEFDEEFGALRGGITEDSFCSYGERKGGGSE